MKTFIKCLILMGMMLMITPTAESIHHQEKFDWSQVLHIPPGTNFVDGNQILHFKSKNKHYSADEQAKRFVETSLSAAIPLQSDAEVLRFGSDAVSLAGAYLEMGVCTGKTINFIGALNPLQKIYGFDSFEGLPEDWVKTGSVITKGTFAFKNPSQLPPVLHNVVLYKGWFKDVLPLFKQEILKDTPIAFLHVDCDIYSATKTVFDELGDNIVNGTIIVFDELYNYPGCENHEMQALKEFTEKRGLSVEYLAYNIYHEQVAVCIRTSK